ncbi:hypothetical protein FFLO_06376 [Filobasidium floriforme]|uniref:mRNA guanylyltransferase n=1 Tax=Filobasidium floriforme TaxID=5210 RepID=A0A8K0JKN5_9TREE|nr:hypothetical protein FFLO_06376 [Filobasidium floriforme]
MNPYLISTNPPPQRPPRPPEPSKRPHEQHPIPDIPGRLIPTETRNQVQSLLVGLVPGFTGRFPGAQPVSMTYSSLTRLEENNFWVCEKTDGVRVLLLIVWNGLSGRQETFLVDRKNDYRQIDHLYFPHHEAPMLRPGFAGNQADERNWCSTTLVDGELVLDKDKVTGQYKLRYYVFDMLVYNKETMMLNNLEKRYGKMQGWLIKPQRQYYKLDDAWRRMAPFEVLAKPMELAYGLDKVLLQEIPKLEHGHDGLIFTRVDSPYVVGEDSNILKWKPPNENSVDFKLTLRFPASAENPNLPDLSEKPIFLLHVFRGGRGQEAYTFCDRMVVSDDEWEAIKASGEQYDERIVECAWNEDLQSWTFMRFRDDKHDGNFIDIVDKIIDSIRDGVVEAQLLDRVPAIREGHRERKAKAAQTARPPPDQNRPTKPTIPTAPRPTASLGMPKPTGYPMPTGRYGSGILGGGLRR